MGVRIIKVALKEYTCERCGHMWLQRMPGTPEPEVCVNKACKSRYWKLPRETKAQGRLQPSSRAHPRGGS